MIRIKVCGMRDVSNIADIIRSKPDFIGYIFYPGSKRFIGQKPDMQIFNIPDTIKKVGVFVNENPDRIIEAAHEYHLDCIQMHGNEPIADCEKIKSAGYTLIKAIGIDFVTRFDELKPYSEVADFFLFDTKTELHGGSGQKFQWNRLSEYHFRVPFFLSGGITPRDVAGIREIIHPSFFGVDINSKFESSPGFKDAGKINSFIREIRSATN